jgi:hypothetical protein
MQARQLPAALQPQTWLQRCGVLPYLDYLDGMASSFPPTSDAAVTPAISWKHLAHYTSGSHQLHSTQLAPTLDTRRMETACEHHRLPHQ